MSKLAHSNQKTMDQIERQQAFEDGNEDLLFRFPQNPDDPNEWMDMALRAVNDEGTFSQDQIATLKTALHLVFHGAAAMSRAIVQHRDSP